MSARGRFFARVLHLARVVGEVGPAVERPERRDEREAERGEREAPGRDGRREVAARLREAEDERDDDDEDEAAVLREDRHVADVAARRTPTTLKQAVSAIANAANQRTAMTRVGRLRVLPDHAEEVLGEGDRDRAERRRADHRELAPAEEEPGEAAPAVAAEDVHAARLREARSRPRRA